MAGGVEAMKRYLDQLKAIVHRFNLNQVGAVSIEYVGLAMVAAAIVGGIYLSLNGGLTHSVNQALGQAAISFDGNGGGPAVNIDQAGGGGTGGGGGQELDAPNSRRGGGASPEMGYMEPTESSEQVSRSSFLGQIWDGISGFFRKLLGGDTSDDTQQPVQGPNKAFGDLLEEDTEQPRSAFGDFLQEDVEQPRTTFGEIMHENKSGTPAKPISRASMDGSSTEPYYVKSGQLTLSGKGTPGETLYVYANGRRVMVRNANNQLVPVQVTVGADGNWAVDVSTGDLKLSHGQDNKITVGKSSQNTTASANFVYNPTTLDVPYHSQGSGNNYCGQTAVLMATEYYASQDSEANNRAGSIKEVVDTEKHTDNYTTTQDHLKNILVDDYGYEQTNYTNDWSKDDLKNALNAGHPVISLVRVDMSPSGVNHWVVVTRLSEDGASVSVNDPLRGQYDVGWSTFWSVWNSHGTLTTQGVEVVP